VLGLSAFLMVLLVLGCGHEEEPEPPAAEIETRPVLKLCIEARAALAELKIAGDLLPEDRTEPDPDGPVADEPGERADPSEAEPDDAEEAEPVVVGRVARMSPSAPDCGYLHVAAAVEYEVRRAEVGELEDDRVVVLVGCPELAGGAYGRGAGDAPAVEVGHVHRLTLAREAPEVAGGLSVVDDIDAPGTHRWWAARVDIVSPAALRE